MSLKIPYEKEFEDEITSLENDQEIAEYIEIIFEQLKEIYDKNIACLEHLTQRDDQEENIKSEIIFLEDKIQEILKKISSRTIAIEQIEKEISLLHTKHDTLINKYEKNKKRPELSEKEKLLLEKSKLKYELYKEITSVRFNYDKNKVKGYIRGKKNGRLASFDMDTENPADDLFKLIEETVTK